MPAIVPLIIAGVSAGTQVYAAKKQSDAAQSAANTQGQYGQKALNLEQQQYQQQQRNLSPYLQAGQSVLPGLTSTAQQRPPQFVPPGGQPQNWFGNAAQQTQPYMPPGAVPWVPNSFSGPR
jgi:hypothetical protein